MTKYRQDFAPLRVENPVAYLDNACTTLRPDSVVEAINSYYQKTPGCGGRSAHRWGTAVTGMVARSRRLVSDFINAQRDEIVFTLNSTAGINQVARGIDWNKQDIVLTSDKEHNSNLIPWLQLQKLGQMNHQTFQSNDDNTFSIEAFEEACQGAGDNLRLVSVPFTSNLDGLTNPVNDICKIAHDYGAEVLLDSAQALPHQRIDVGDIGCDYLTFSLHKMLGPSGIGVLYGKEESLGNLEPISGGGKTVKSSSLHDFEFTSLPSRFEGGSSNYAGIIGAASAIQYLNNVDFDWLIRHENRLNQIISSGVSSIDGVSIIGPSDANQRGGITAMTVDGVDVIDLSIILDESESIMVRSGYHCVNSWFQGKGLGAGSLRTSAYLYNTEEEAKLFVDTFTEAVEALT